MDEMEDAHRRYADVVRPREARTLLRTLLLPEASRDRDTRQPARCGR